MALANKKHSRIYSTTGSDSDWINSTKLNRMQSKFTNKEYLEDEDAFETLAPLIYQMEQMSQELDELRRFTSSEVGTKMILNCGWVGSTTSRQYLPFGYGGTYDATSTNGYLEYGGWVAPCNGSVESVIIRSENFCGYSSVGLHFASNNTEVPTLHAGTGHSDTINMNQDDTPYKFLSFDGQYASNLNTFSAGQVVMVSFDPSSASGDSIATMVLNLDWTTAL